MADDPVEAARRREAAMLRRSSYFPAANLRQYEGTELSPPGAGTYYNPSRYVGASYGNRQRASRELSGAYQSDLAFNVMHNPRQAAALDAERIGAQYGGKSRVGQAGYTTITLPSGGTTTVPTREAARIAALPGYSILDPTKIAREGFQKGYGTVPQTPSVVEGDRGTYLSRGGIMNPIENVTPAERYQYGTTFGQNLRASGPIGQALYGLGTLGYNAYQALSRGMSGGPAQYARQQFGGPSPVASERGDLLRDTDNIFYGGGQAPAPTPTPTPSTSSNPRLAGLGDMWRNFYRDWIQPPTPEIEKQRSQDYYNQLYRGTPTPTPAPTSNLVYGEPRRYHDDYYS